MNNTSWSQDRLVVICNWWCRQMKFLSVPSFGEIYVRSNSTKVWFDSFECTVANEVAIVVLPSSSSSFQAIAIAMRSIVAKKMHLNRKYVDRNDVLTFSGLGGGDNDDGDGVGDPDNHNGMFSLSPLGRVFVPWLECGCHLPHNNPPPSKSYGDPVYTITHLPRATPSCRGGHPCRQWIRKFPAHTIAPPPKRSHCQKRKANFTLNFDKDREPTILCPDPCRWSTFFSDDKLILPTVKSVANKKMLPFTHVWVLSALKEYLTQADCWAGKNVSGDVWQDWCVAGANRATWQPAFLISAISVRKSYGGEQLERLSYFIPAPLLVCLISLWIFPTEKDLCRYVLNAYRVKGSMRTCNV